MLNSLQVLRGLAAWAVVIHHIVQSYLMGDSRHFMPLALAQKYGALGVDVFFVLSGLVMALAAKKHMASGFTFGINRAYRVIPVYWFYSLLLVASISILPKGTYLTWWEGYSLIKSLLFIPNVNPNGYGYFPTLYVGWTLIYEMFFYLVFTAALTLRLPRPTISCAVLLVIIALLPRDIIFLGSSSLLLIEFSMGIFIVEIMKASAFKQNPWLRILFVSSLLLLTICLKKLGYELQSNMTLAGFIVLAFTQFESFFSKDSKLHNFLKSLGDWSYSTYLNHVIVIGWFYYLLGDKHSAFLDAAAFAGIISTVYLLSRLSFELVESNKYIAQLKLATTRMLTRTSAEVDVRSGLSTVTLPPVDLSEPMARS
jgi:exopolysaccharide production protein ExoZ